MILVLENSTPAATPLFEGTPYSASVNPNSIRYFSVDVPAWALYATNILSAGSGPLNLLYNQAIEPTGTNAGDFTLLSSVPSRNQRCSPPTAHPNWSPARATTWACRTPTPVWRSNFNIEEVDFDITTLSNAVLVPNVIAPTTVPHYFQFDVTTNAPLGSSMTAAAFEILSPFGGDVNLVVKKGLPLPDLNTFDYSSSNPGTSNEGIVVVTNSSPVPLTAGRWYLAVFNNAVNVVGYHIRATEPGLPNIIDLTNGVPVAFSSDPGVALTNFFHFNISPAATTNNAVLFTLTGLTGNVDLDVQQGSLPYAGPFATGGSFQILERTSNQWPFTPIHLAPLKWRLVLLGIPNNASDQRQLHG